MKKPPSPAEALSLREAQAEHERLAAELAKHDIAYHQQDAPTISDADYDALRRRYEALEAAFPELAATGSALQRVGAAPADKFAKVRHAVPMLSLGNVFADEEVTEFVARVRRFLGLGGDAPLAFTAEPKIDGLSCSLRYERGELVQAATRGDGFEGEDVTNNVRTIKEVPQRLKGGKAPKICEIRGEIYMTRSAFLDLNRQASRGRAHSIYVNLSAIQRPRSLRQKDPLITGGQRPLHFFAYAWGEMSDLPAPTQHGMIEAFP